jgi:hypothetical protein
MQSGLSRSKLRVLRNRLYARFKEEEVDVSVRSIMTAFACRAAWGIVKMSPNDPSFSVQLIATGRPRYISAPSFLELREGFWAQTWSLSIGML